VIVNVSSMNATVAFPMRLAYNAVKAPVTRTELLEEAIRGGFVNDCVRRADADQAPRPPGGDRQGGALSRLG